MNLPRLSSTISILLITLSSAFAGDWKSLTSTIEYAEFSPDPPVSYRVARMSIDDPAMSIVVTPESDRGMTVTAFSRKRKAVIGINGDYFDEKLRPIGMTIGSCGPWSSRAPSSQRKQALLAIGESKAMLVEGAEVAESGAPAWARVAISGWPVLVRGCRALTPTELPGSDAFTRSPHPRTAVGLSEDQKTIFLVTAEGKKNGEKGGNGVTLGELASFMQEELGACFAVNLDGGGSTAMAVAQKLVTRPSAGTERVVANHIAIVRKDDILPCSATPEVPVPMDVAVGDIWNDVREITGSKGVVERSTLSFDLSGSTADAIIRLQPAEDGVTFSGTVSGPLGSAAGIMEILKGPRVTAINLPRSPADAGQWVLFQGRLPASEAAHVIRRMIDRYQLTPVPSKLPASRLAFQKLAVTFAEDFIRTGSDSLRVRLIDKTGASRTWRVAGDLVFRQATDSGTELEGVIRFRSEREGALVRELKAVGVTLGQTSPAPQDPGYSIGAINGRLTDLTKATLVRNAIMPPKK